MSATDDVLAQIPLGQLAQMVGEDESTTRAAVEQAVPALLGGMQANAQDAGGAASLTEALGQHSGEVPQPEQVDTADGQTIVSHIFGSNEQAVTNQLGGVSGGSQGLIQKLLPILAPIVMSYLANKVLKGGGGGLGDILGGGNQQAQGQQPQQGQPQPTPDASQQGTGQAQGGLGDILGDLLGSSGSNTGGGLGDILGGLLGGGRKS